MSEQDQHARSVLRVVERLDAAHFENLPSPFHGVVSLIGDEARPVPAAAEPKHVASALGIAPGSDGFVRSEFELPEEVRDLPDAAFALQVQRLPGTTVPEMLAKMSRTVLARQITEGWKLIREAAGHASLVYEHGDPVDTYRYSLHLFVLRPGPAWIASHPFEVPANATLELAYGVQTAPDAEGRRAAHFDARLRCGDEPATLIVREVLGASQEAGWHDVFVPLPSTGATCRLDLSVRGPAGKPVRGAAWAVPRIVAAAPASDPLPPNLVLISLDTLRADHLSGLGYRRQTSPRIDAELIARGTTLSDTTSTYSRTDVSHMSLFSALFPEARVVPGRVHADTPVPLLAERLRDAGFHTAAYTEDALLAGVFGFWFGFDRFTERAYRHEDRGRGTFDDGIEYLRANRNRRFFLFLHTYKTHEPYVASRAYEALFSDPAEWSRSGMGRIPDKFRARTNAYDRTIREADDLVGKFLNELSLLGLADRTLVVLLSDHGEAFGEHGLTGHSFSSHQEVMRVPVVFRGPGVPEGLQLDAPTSLVDIAPTIVELLGLEPSAVTQGLSLVPAFHGEALPEKRPLYFSWLGDETLGVRHGRWKYRSAGQSSALFDLETDPREMRAVEQSHEQHLRSERLLSGHRKASAKIRDRFVRTAVAPASPAISEETEKSLRALGYIDQ